MTNRPLNTATMTNKENGSQSLTWDEATFTWDSAQGTWDNPYTINNKSGHTGSMTNRPL